MPVGYCLESVDGEPNTWDLTVRAVPFPDLEPPCGCIGRPACEVAGYNVELGSAQTVIIRKLTIVRPVAANISVVLGNSFFPPLTRVDEVYTEPQGQDGRNGHVSVQVYVSGPLGRVTNVNRLIVGTGDGDIEGPINAVMHPESSRDHISDPDNIRISFIRLSSSAGSLVGDVTIAPSPGENPVRGVMSLLWFPIGNIGANAVNRVNIHADDCDPPFPEPGIARVLHPSDAPTPDDPIEVRHYGPVKRPAEGRAFTIRVRRVDLDPENPSAWTDATSLFTECVDRLPECREGPGTAVRLTAQGDGRDKLPGGYEYHVIQNQNEKDESLLVCDLPESGPPADVPVENFPRESRFFVCDTNVVPFGDANSDGAVDFADVTSVLSNFGLTGPILLGDANKDGEVNFTDVSSVLTHWGSPFCTSGGQSFASSADGMTALGLDGAGLSSFDPVLTALAQMGYDSIEAFTLAISRMSEEDRNAEVRRLGRLLGGEE